MKILEIKKLSKDYYTNKNEIKALKDISFSINEGEFIGIVGPSGSGKSTLLSILSNLEEYTSGEIIKKDNLKIGYMMQDDLLFPWLTIYQNCLLGLKINKILTKENKEYAKHLLNTYGLEEFVNNYPQDLSGGMRKRVALIRTLVTRPDLILLDEPFSALDYQTRLNVSKDVLNILKNESQNLVIVTHDVVEALNMCNKIIVFSKRPAVVKKIYYINEEDKMKYYDMIWNDLNEE